MSDSTVTVIKTGALRTGAYIVLTDVDGLMKDKNDPSTLIRDMHMDDIDALVEQQVTQGGMLPKVEACRIAVAKGAVSARILNGTTPESIAAFEIMKAETITYK